MTVRQHVQKSALGARVVLWKLDLSLFGQSNMYVTGGPQGGSAVSFGGQSYSPHPVRADGFEVATGKLPQPTWALANIDGILSPIVETYDDLIGATLTRIRTYDRYLDGGAEPNSAAKLPEDSWLLAQKMRDDHEVIQWKLVAMIDQEGVMLPGRQVVQDYCDHRVRRWNGSSFDYTDATCPYVGTPRDIDGNVTTGALEVFSKRLNTCCQARFGETAALPTRAFPGVARVRQR